MVGPYLQWVPPIVPALRKMQESRRLFKKISEELLHAVPMQLDSLLERIKKVNHEMAQSGEKTLSDTEILSNCVGFAAGGNDSTSAALTAAFYELARHPDIQKEVRTRLLTGDETLLRDVIRETLRVYPPFARSFPRIAQKLAQVGDYNVEKGFPVMVDIWQVNVQRKIHDSNDEEETVSQQPITCENNANENSTNKHADLQTWDPVLHNAHNTNMFSFGVGPRSCIGRHIADIVLMGTLKHILTHYEVMFDNGAVMTEWVSRMGVTQPAKPLAMKFNRLN